MLAGADDRWIYADQDSQSKNYFNLSPGPYTFRVATRGIKGQWGDPAEFSFRIFPPWWRTWWAYLVYAILALGCIWVIVQYRSRRLKKENRLLEEKVTQRTNELQETISNLKSTQSQLVQSEKMASLGELTAGIAHEIQNPLNFVNNFAEVSNELIDEMNEELDNGDIKEAKIIANDIKSNLDKITHHGKRADSIVKGMLQHSRTSGNKKEPTDINALADEYMRLAYHGLRAKDKSFNANLESNFDDTIEKIKVIPQDIGRVILNLFTNAFYAVTEKKASLTEAESKTYKPTVSVTTKKIEEFIQISVKDNGNGIPKEALNKIFQPFFTTKPTGKGTGLGLSMSYDIIKTHGGSLDVETEKGAYTRFTIKLPI
jgi:signal transduction histidine kinase